MSRVQLALNVDDLESAVGFYSKLFGTEPAKLRPGYANFADRGSAAEARARRGTRRARLAEPPRRRGRVDRRGRGGHDRAWPTKGWRRRPRTRSPVASPCRTRCGSTRPTASRGRSTPSWRTSRRRPVSSRDRRARRRRHVLRCGARSPRRAAAEPSARDARSRHRPARQRGGGRHRAARGDGGRFRDRRAAAVARRRRSPAAGERDRDRRGARRADPRLRARSRARTSTRW